MFEKGKNAIICRKPLDYGYELSFISIYQLPIPYFAASVNNLTYMTSSQNMSIYKPSKRNIMLTTGIEATTAEIQSEIICRILNEMRESGIWINLIEVNQTLAVVLIENSPTWFVMEDGYEDYLSYTPQLACFSKSYNLIQKIKIEKEQITVNLVPDASTFASFTPAARNMVIETIFNHFKSDRTVDITEILESMQNFLVLSASKFLTEFAFNYLMDGSCPVIYVGMRENNLQPATTTSLDFANLLLDNNSNVNSFLKLLGKLNNIDNLDHCTTNVWEGYHESLTPEDREEISFKPLYELIASNSLESIDLPSTSTEIISFLTGIQSIQYRERLFESNIPEEPSCSIPSQHPKQAVIELAYTLLIMDSVKKDIEFVIIDDPRISRILVVDGLLHYLQDITLTKYIFVTSDITEFEEQGLTTIAPTEAFETGRKSVDAKLPREKYCYRGRSGVIVGVRPPQLHPIIFTNHSIPKRVLRMMNVGEEEVWQSILSID